MLYLSLFVFFFQIIASAASSGEENKNVAELVNNESEYTWVENPEVAQPSMEVDAVNVSTERDDDTQSSHSDSGLPLEEGEFGLLPDPVSPAVPVSLPEVRMKREPEGKEAIENFNELLHSGFGYADPWNDEQLFPELNFRDDMMIS